MSTRNATAGGRSDRAIVIGDATPHHVDTRTYLFCHASSSGAGCGLCTCERRAGVPAQVNGRPALSKPAARSWPR